MEEDPDIEYGKECAEKLRRLIAYSTDGPVGNTCAAYLQHALDQIEGELSAQTKNPG